MKMNNVIVNRTMSRMLLKEEKQSVLGRCKVIKKERENFTDSIGSGATKRDIPKQKQTIEKECSWVDVDADDLEKARAVNKQRKEKMRQLKADQKQEFEQSQKYYEGNPDKNGMVMIRKDVLDGILDGIHPETPEELEETEKLAPAELRKRQSEKASETKKRQRERNSQHRREKWISGALEEADIGAEGKQAPKKPIRITIGAKKDEVEEAKKKEKKNCSPGAVYHDDRGRFTDKKNAASYSLQFVPGGSDCKSGVAKMPGQRFTKSPCGRRSKHSGKKAPYKCKDGSPSS